jgi:hypothetical protein
MSQNNIIYQIHCSTPRNKNNINLLFIQLADVWFPIISSKVRALERGHKHSGALVSTSMPGYTKSSTSHSFTRSYRSALGTTKYGIVGGPAQDERINAPTKVFIPYKHEDSNLMHRMNPLSDHRVS